MSSRGHVWLLFGCFWVVDSSFFGVSILFLTNRLTLHNTHGGIRFQELMSFERVFFNRLVRTQTGMRIGQCLGLRHEDLSVEDGEIHIGPRDDNPNGARTKTQTTSTIPGMEDVMALYTDYLIHDLGALEAPTLPDFVFVNLQEGEIGRPMTYAVVMSLVKRLRKQTGIRLSPHMLRHSRATIWIRDDQLPLPTVSRLLTHTSIQTTNDTYLQLTPQDLKKALKEGKGDEYEH
jgi:integrase/recombinase XerD